MKRLVISPTGWPCTLEQCPPGYFVFGEALCLKTEYYQTDGRSDAFVSSGEFFQGGTKDAASRQKLTVQPAVARWEDVDE